MQPKAPYNAPVMSDPGGPDLRQFSTVTIVGVGLIGGSLALGLRQRKLVERVFGVGRNPARLAEAVKAGVIDDGTTDLGAAARESQLVVFCTPVDRVAAGVLEAAPLCQPGTLFTDAGSTKSGICRELTGRLPREVEFVGSHPLAGSEKQGFEHAIGSLYDGRVCVVTPLPENSAGAVSQIEKFWRGLGASVFQMSPEAHDRALAETSHLPHLAAAALADTLRPENALLTATGFRDTTRIAAGDPDLWTAIFLSNQDSLLASLADFQAKLDDFRDAIEHNEPAALKNLLKAAKMARDALDNP